MLGSVAVYFIVTLAYTAICVTCTPPSNPYWVLQRQMVDPMFYLVCILATVVALLPRYYPLFIHFYLDLHFVSIRNYISEFQKWLLKDVLQIHIKLEYSW